MNYADFENREQYRSWVRTIAMNNIERDGSPVDAVAEMCIYDVQALSGGEVALLTVADPYSNTRARPTDVILHHGEEERARHYKLGMGFRELAVCLLASDLSEAMEEVVAEP